MSDNLKRLDISKNEKFGQEEDALPQFERLARLYKKPLHNPMKIYLQETKLGERLIEKQGNSETVRREFSAYGFNVICEISQNVLRENLHSIFDEEGLLRKPKSEKPPMTN